MNIIQFPSFKYIPFKQLKAGKIPQIDIKEIYIFGNYKDTYDVFVLDNEGYGNPLVFNVQNLNEARLIALDWKRKLSNTQND